MYTLKDNDVIREIVCGNNFEYVLEDNSYFVNTDYKVLQSQTNGIFIQCMKMTRNGKTDLYYITNDYRPMSSMFVGITADLLIAVVVNLFASVIEVRNNGFLACQCIDLSWDKIFVEQNTLKVKLVYLPLSVKAFDSYAEFESELRSSIVKLINKVIVETNERLNQFVQDLCNGSLSIEDVYNRSRSVGTPSIPKREENRTPAPVNNASGTIKLVAMNAPGHFELPIDSADILIGKKQEMVDKVILFNNMISRKHCRITCVNGIYFISDEGSANGTFVNGARVAQGQRCQINRGDIIRLANSDFQIV
ncbi:MAG: FHA domain-containing protein [Lachnospiraceae bacterium]|nr:FHA domain-containing protein [Lachnospiraceae bacterium]